MEYNKPVCIIIGNKIKKYTIKTLISHELKYNCSLYVIMAIMPNKTIRVIARIDLNRTRKPLLKFLDCKSAVFESDQIKKLFECF